MRQNWNHREPLDGFVPGTPCGCSQKAAERRKPESASLFGRSRPLGYLGGEGEVEADEDLRAQVCNVIGIDAEALDVGVTQPVSE